MTTDTTTNLYDSATNLYLGWVDASIQINERLAHVARVYIDESLGLQQDLADAARRAIEDAQTKLTRDGDVPNPLLLASRAGEVLRGGYAIWNEAGLKAQERFARIAQTAFQEMQTAQTSFTDRAQERVTEFNRAFSRVGAPLTA